MVGDSGGRCFCRRALITLVAPLHWPVSANAATSVCLHSKQERSLRCRPIIRPCLMVGLGSPVSAGRSAIASARRDPSLCFDTCTKVAETRPLPAVSRAHLCQLFVQRCPMGVGGDSPAHCPGADRPLCFPGRAPPVASCPGHFVTFHACHCPICRSIDGVPASAGNSVGTGPHQRSNSDRACKRYVLGRNRVSIETRKLHIILDPGMRFPEN